LNKDTATIFNTFYEIIEKLSNEKPLMLYVMATIDGILFDERNKYVAYLKNILESETKEPNILTRLYNLLTTPDFDPVVYESTARVLSILLSEVDPKKYYLQQENLNNYLTNQTAVDLKDKKRKVGDHCVATCLVNLFRLENIVKHFLKTGGMQRLVTLLRYNSDDIQTTYNTFVALWLLSFDPQTLIYFNDAQVGTIKAMIQSVQKLSREKVIRVGYATFKNLSESEAAIELMVDGGLLKVTDILSKSIIKDEEIKKDIEVLGQTLERNLKILTSFEKYKKEVQNGVLEWGPIHSERFWRENYKKMEDDNFTLIQQIIRFLHDNYDKKPELKSKNLAIACYDIGEFCRHHPFGKKILDKFDCKAKIMDLIKSDIPEVRENATMAIQKMLLNNWQAVEGFENK